MKRKMTIKQIAQSQGITLTELAKLMGYSRVHITNVANGAPAGPKLAKKLVAWSDRKLTTDDLLEPYSH